MGTVTRRALLAAAAAPAVRVVAPPAAAVTSSQLSAQLAGYQRLRGDVFGLYLWDYRTNGSFSFNAGMRSQTLSTINLLVAVALHKVREEQGTWLTTTEQSLCSAMITRSDNAATDRLIRSHVGLAVMRRVALDCQMDHTAVQGGTTAGAADWWGYSTTIPFDLLRLMNVVMLGTSYLSWRSRSNIQWLMSQVVSSQRWGVCDPPLPTDVLTRVKNGWGPYTGGYRLNSVGFVGGRGRKYAMSVLLVAPAGYSHGYATINQVSRMVFDALGAPLG